MECLQTLSSPGVPQFDCVIITARGQTSTIGTVYHCSNIIPVSYKSVQAFPSSCIPHFHCIIIAGRSNSIAIRAVHHWPHETIMTIQGFQACCLDGIPNLDRIIIRSRHQCATIWRPSYRFNRWSLPQVIAGHQLSCQEDVPIKKAHNCHNSCQRSRSSPRRWSFTRINPLIARNLEPKLSAILRDQMLALNVGHSDIPSNLEEVNLQGSMICILYGI